MEEFFRYFKTGIPDDVLNVSLCITIILILSGLVIPVIRNKRKYYCWVLLIEYLFVVVCSTIIFRRVIKAPHIEFTPFWTYKAAYTHVVGVSYWDIILNMALFVPLGLLLSLIFPRVEIWKVIVIAIACSMCIEVSQFIWMRGVCQFDDIMHNSIGAAFGCYVARLLGGYGLK